MRVSVEVCVTSLEEALAAQAAGADTVELCSWLAVGGVTPSAGTVRVVRERCTVPVRVLLRPHGGGFRYNADEADVIEKDALALGGPLVMGALDDAGLPDVALMRRLLGLAVHRGTTFHRAIDHSTDLLRSADSCAELGFGRILTSGGRSTAVEGAEQLRQVVQRHPQLIIAAAGGIRAENVVEVVQRTGVTEVHFAAQRPVAAPAGPALSSGGSADGLFVPDVAKMEGVLNALVKAGLR